HDADCSYRALLLVVESRLLIRLRCEQQPVERVLGAVLLEQLARLPQPLGVPRAAGIANELAFDEVLLEFHVAPERAFAMLLVELADELAQLRIVLAHSPGERRVGAQLYGLVNAQL